LWKRSTGSRRYEANVWRLFDLHLQRTADGWRFDNAAREAGGFVTIVSVAWLKFLGVVAEDGSKVAIARGVFADHVNDCDKFGKWPELAFFKFNFIESSFSHATARQTRWHLYAEHCAFGCAREHP